MENIYKVFQKKLLDTLMSGGRVSYFETEKNMVGITINGYGMMFIRKSALCVDLSKCSKVDALTVYGNLPSDSVALERTGNMKRISGGRTVLEYKAESFSVWVDEKLVKEYGADFTPFGKSPLEPVFYLNAAKEIVSLVLPTRIGKVE